MKIPDELLFRRRKHLPVILSAEGAECGLACVAMVANYHGHEIDLNGLRQVFNFSLSGATLRSLMTIADRLELSTRALKCEMKALSNITLPAILHWNLNHFVF
jgi:ATP-binding cassette subfamily B protein RaxB